MELLYIHECVGIYFSIWQRTYGACIIMHNHSGHFKKSKQISTSRYSIYVGYSQA